MKRAMAFESLVMGIAVIAGLLILIFFVSKMGASVFKLADNSECKASILKHSARIALPGTDDDIAIECPTKYYDNVPAKSEGEVNYILAESMRSCWDTWGKGDLQLFRKDNLYCHVCSVMTFKDKTIKDGTFAQYLLETPVPNDKDELSYAKYLRFYATDESDAKVKESLTSQGTAVPIDTSKEYAVIFIYAKGDNVIRNFLIKVRPELGPAYGGAVWGGIVAGTGGVVLLTLGVVSGGTIPLVMVAGGIVGGFFYGLAKGVNAEYMATIMLREYDAASLERLGCKDLPIRQDNQKNKIG